MFLSQLLLDIRHLQVRQDLRNAYDLHRTLLRALPESGAGRVLFRCDMGRAGQPVVLVQSELEPLWKHLPPGYAHAQGPKPLDVVSFARGQRLHFVLRANPTRRLRSTVGGEPLDPRWHGKRVGLLREDDQQAWLIRKAEAASFRVLDVRLIPEGTPRAWKKDHDLSLVAVRFEGSLEVLDAEIFRKAWLAGIGSGKGLGFGLLSVATARG